MPRPRKPKLQKVPRPTPPPPVEQSRAELTQAIEHLRALAEATKSKAPTPVFDAYMRAGCSTSYQRDYDVYSRHQSVAMAYEYAAYQLGQTLTFLESSGQHSLLTF